MVNKPKEAIESYKKAVKISESSPEFHFNLATAYMEVGEFMKALNSFRNCLKYDP
jgi:Tfp pilus assembly protein PilF